MTISTRRFLARPSGVSLGISGLSGPTPINALDGYASYLATSVWPSGLAVFYPLLGPPPLWRAAVGTVALGAVSTVAVHQLGRRPWLAVGWFWFVGMLIPMIGLAQVGVGTSDLLVLGALALSGIGLGASMPSLAAAIANSVEERDLGVVGASQQMVGQLGVVAGIQILQTVQLAREGAVGEAASYGDAYLVGAAVAAVAFVLALFLRRSVAAPAPMARV